MDKKDQRLCPISLSVSLPLWLSKATRLAKKAILFPSFFSILNFSIRPIYLPNWSDRRTVGRFVQTLARKQTFFKKSGQFIKQIKSQVTMSNKL